MHNKKAMELQRERAKNQRSSQLKKNNKTIGNADMISHNYRIFNFQMLLYVNYPPFVLRRLPFVILFAKLNNAL